MNILSLRAITLKQVEPEWISSAEHKRRYFEDCR